MKLRQIITFLIPLIIAIVLSACNSPSQTIRGSGKSTSEGRTIGDVSRVSLETLGDLSIQLGDQESLSVEAEDNLLPYIETNMQGGLLIIREKPGINIQPTQPVRYVLNVKGLTAIEDSSSGNIKAPTMQADNFTVKISSSGEVQLDGLQANKLDTNLSSSGNLNIGTGQVGQQNVTITSSGNYQAGDLRSQAADIKISSSGSATAWVTDKLDATLSSSGNLNYYGSPSVTQSTSSSGKVVSLGNK